MPQGAGVAGRQSGGERVQIREAIAIDIELLVRNAAVAVRIQRQRLPGDIGAVVDEILCQAIPAADLVAQVVVVHAAELQPKAGCQVGVERRLQQRLPRAGVAVVAVRVLGFRIGVVAEISIPERIRAAELGAQDAFLPTTDIDADGARPAGNELSGFLDPGGLWVEVEITADLGRSVDGRGRSADDIDAVGRTDRRRVIAGIVEPAHPPEIGLAGRAPDVEGPGDAEEGLRERAGCQRDQLVDVAHVEAVHHFSADRRYGPRRLQQRPVEAEDSLHGIPRQAAEIADNHDFLDNAGGGLAFGFVLRGIARCGEDQYRGNWRSHARGQLGMVYSRTRQLELDSGGCLARR